MEFMSLCPGQGEAIRKAVCQGRLVLGCGQEPGAQRSLLALSSSAGWRCLAPQTPAAARPRKRSGIRASCLPPVSLLWTRWSRAGPRRQALLSMATQDATTESKQELQSLL